MEQEKMITLDLTGCKYLGEIHQRIKNAFGFPDFYGENWSAFWDLLRSECDSNRIIVLGINTISEEYRWHNDKMQEILQRLKKERAKYGERVEIEIRD